MSPPLQSSVGNAARKYLERSFSKIWLRRFPSQQLLRPRSLGELFARILPRKSLAPRLLPNEVPICNLSYMPYSVNTSACRCACSVTTSEKRSFCNAIGQIIDTVTSAECANYLFNAGYDHSHPALTIEPLRRVRQSIRSRCSSACRKLRLM